MFYNNLSIYPTNKQKQIHIFSALTVHWPITWSHRPQRPIQSGQETLISMSPFSRARSKWTTYLTFLWSHTGRWRVQASFCGSLKHVSCYGKWTAGIVSYKLFFGWRWLHPSSINQVRGEQAGFRWSARPVSALDSEQAWAHSCVIHLTLLTSEGNKCTFMQKHLEHVCFLLRNSLYCQGCLMFMLLL